MNFSKAQKQRAGTVLSQSQTDYRKIVCIHGAVSLGATLILALIDLLFAALTSDMGGLSVRWSRAIIETVQSLLSLGVSFALPLWQLGILYTSIRMTRQQDVSVNQLTRGFQRLGSLIMYYLLLMAILIGVSTVAANISVILFGNTIQIPDSLLLNGVQDPMQLLENPDFWNLLSIVAPVVIFASVLVMAVMIYIFYRFRLCTYLLLDDPKIGMMQSVSLSNRMTKGYKWRLCKLDLSFWWYFLLQGLAGSIALMPQFLPDSAVLFLVCQVVSILLSLGLLWWKGAYVEVTYACAYDQLRTPPQQITVI